MSKVPWIALAVGVGGTALAVLSGRSGSRAQPRSREDAWKDKCGQCGKALGEDRVYGLEEYAFCSGRCLRENEAEHAAEGAFDDAELRDREGTDFEDDREW
jgi:endogenous inhibitor of DNA gyrase (YacG/DUF329 family)